MKLFASKPIQDEFLEIRQKLFNDDVPSLTWEQLNQHTDAELCQELLQRRLPEPLAFDLDNVEVQEGQVVIKFRGAELYLDWDTGKYFPISHFDRVPLVGKLMGQKIEIPLAPYAQAFRGDRNLFLQTLRDYLRLQQMQVHRAIVELRRELESKVSSWIQERRSELERERRMTGEDD
ncbi:hypothetical protein A7Q09_05430 [Methylacidiphilum sp. Yel]|uniref:hypothetical protein n=1 Tax=Methylacidiphilum sp. Yel TaxID=1847730 RepID=UPI00106CE1EE|nr:hypothetical protein [Methylacidiphilum sp. Yel]TFE69334.1 hypothetical protein A7Q09_05430 [Methylacidiphilum sp. Yel]